MESFASSFAMPGFDVSSIDHSAKAHSNGAMNGTASHAQNGAKASTGLVSEMPEKALPAGSN